MFVNPRKILNRDPRRRGGVATVEMAMVAPFVFLLIFTWFEFARMLMVKQALTNSCREACRHAALATTQTDKEVQAFLEDRLRGIVCGQRDCTDIIKSEITPKFDETPPVSGSAISIQVEVECDDISWLPPFFFGGASLQSTASMIRE